MTVLEINDISKQFGENHVLNGINIHLEKGKIYTIVGGNGAGKSTLFNIITGFLRADSGNIYFKSKKITKTNPVRINHLGITRTFQDLRLITELSVRENILLAFKNNPGEKIFNAMLPAFVFKKEYSAFAKRAEEILEKVYLTHVQDQLAGEISYGQQKLLTIGCCIANDAELLLLDEPIAGIDSENYKRISELLQDIKKDGKTILQIEHNHHFIEELSDSIFYLYNGTSNQFDTYSDFRNNQKVKDSYLN
jgi:ABC-type branched-subunit amino acid transport system ATPase component